MYLSLSILYMADFRNSNLYNSRSLIGLAFELARFVFPAEKKMDIGVTYVDTY